MTAATPIPRHPSTGHLVRQVDGELTAAAEERLTRHLDGCPECRERLAGIRALSATGSQYLRGLQFRAVVDPERRQRARAAVRNAAARRKGAVRTRRGWAAAAMVAGLLIVSLAVDPLRAWVLERLAIGSDAGGGAASVVALPRAVVGGEGSLISFHPSDAVFTVHVEELQASGELLLQVLPMERATAQVIRPERETMMVLPNGLRIENEAGSTASYRVALPAGVERVVVRIGGGAPRELPVEAGGRWTARIALGR